MRGPSSLRARLVLTAAAALLVAVLVAGLALWFGLDRFVRGQVDARLDTQIAAVLSAIEPRGAEIRLVRTVDAPPFDRGGSGWYWEYRSPRAVLRSRSLEDGRVAIEAVPRFDGERPRPASATGPDGQALWARIRPVGPDGLVLATAPVGAINGPLRQALGMVALTLVAVTILMMAAILFQVRLGLVPLGRLELSLAAVRAGRQDRIPLDQPVELRNLVAELNALLAQNAENLDRARMHVANLAHGLKTPLAILALSLAEGGRDPDGRLGREIELMDRRVRHHLRRARAAALSGSNRAVTPLRSCLADLRAAFARLYVAKGVALDIAAFSSETAVACEAEDVDEMLGNLIDNACKWCRGHVWIEAVTDGREVTLAVDDDGPGLGDGDCAAAFLPGRRLDESVPGSGFGLPITRELAELYGGRLALERSPRGGVRARLTLPRAAGPESAEASS